MPKEFSIFLRATTRDCSLVECAARVIARGDAPITDKEIAELPAHLREILIELDAEAPEIDPATEDVHSGWWDYVTSGNIEVVRARTIDATQSTINERALSDMRCFAMTEMDSDYMPTALGSWHNFPWQLQYRCDPVSQLPRNYWCGRSFYAVWYHIINAVRPNADPRDVLVVFD